MHPRAGRTALPEDLIDTATLIRAYYDASPDPAVAHQRVAFGTSGHRGSALNGTFNEDHILAISQAVAEHRASAGVTGPLLVGRDTHALSEPAWQTALEVLLANDVEVLVDSRAGYTPTPALSHAILRLNRLGQSGIADGVVITPSHNPPGDGGFKYNLPNGGPADGATTAKIAARANELLEGGLKDVKRVALDRAKSKVGHYDFLAHYVDDLPSILNLDVIRDAGVKMAADPLGGASVAYWPEIADRHELNLTTVNPTVDPRWAFMPLDSDGKIRMDCSSPWAMADLIRAMEAGQGFDLATGNDADADRHGIVTPDGGLMNPNHFLAAAISYLFSHRPGWSDSLAVGKTVVSSAIIDRVVKSANRRLFETPVGFKYFVDGLADGSVGFAGEESAGASFLRADGGVWTTDKDGILLCLLAAEMRGATGLSPSQVYGQLTDRLGAPVFSRKDQPVERDQKVRLASLGPSDIASKSLAGEDITAVMTKAAGNGEAIGGVKVVTENAWFAARPSGTEDVYKIYAESFLGPDHLVQVQAEAQEIVTKALSA
jgi:phosphoglucomutase